MLDFHNHLMPGVDDGAVDLDESRVGLDTLRRQGVRDIITTPHIRASLTERPRELGIYLGVIDRAWDRLRTLAEAEFPEMRLERGVEIMLDIPHPDLSDPRLRLAGTSFALVEFPFMSIPPHSTRAIGEIVERGWTPVIAHPERYSNMPAHYDLVDDWRDAGGLIQVNSGSFLSFYGSAAKRFAWYLIGRGCVDYLSSDYHSRGKCAVEPCGTELKAIGAEAQWRELTTTNPQRLLRDEGPVAVPPFEPKGRSLLKRLLAWR
jgi:protein-tyrosine phosphatase